MSATALWRYPICASTSTYSCCWSGFCCSRFVLTTTTTYTDLWGHQTVDGAGDRRTQVPFGESTNGRSQDEVDRILEFKLTKQLVGQHLMLRGLMEVEQKTTTSSSSRWFQSRK